MDSIVNFDVLGRIFLFLSAFFGAFLAALWLSLILWTLRDIRSRSRDRINHLLAALLVAILNLPGVLIYLILRPSETLLDVYQRTLEEESLLQEIETKHTCPGCGSVVDQEWQICPHCHTRLKKVCANCGKLMQLPWQLCPYCGTDSSKTQASSSEVPTMPEFGGSASSEIP